MRNERIEVTADVMDGVAVIRGTRIPVALIMRKLGAGRSAEEILVDHARLTHDDIRAVLAFGANRFA